MADSEQEDDEKGERNGFGTSSAVADTHPTRPRYVYRVGWNSCHQASWVVPAASSTDDGASES